MVPGPAIIGIANGVKDISDRFSISFFTFSFFIPLCLLKSPVNKANPEVAIINPPAIFKESNVIPKNDRINFPRKKEISNIINTLNEVQNAILLRSNLLFSWVNPTKTGTVPKGFITENKAPKIIKNNSISFCHKSCSICPLLNEFYAKFRLS